MSSPFGLLVQWARNGDRTNFVPLRPTAPPIAEPAVVPAPIIDEITIDNADITAVASMEADPSAFAQDLAQLDELVARDHPHLAAHGIRPAMRRALRASVLAEWLQTARPDDRTPPAHREVTAGTPAAHPAVTASTPTAHLRDDLRTALAHQQVSSPPSNGTNHR